MKYLCILLSFLFCFSCSSDDEVVEITQPMLEGKWLIENSEEYFSIEFNKSHTCLIQKITDGESIFVYDSYTFNSGEVVMEREGKLSNISIDDNSISFTLTFDGNQTNLTGNADVALVNESEINDLFTRSWSFEFAGGDGDLEPVPEPGVHIFFSKNGTYYVNDFLEEDYSVIRYWKWADTANNIVCFSDVADFECQDEGNYATIASITEDSLTLVQDDHVDDFTLILSAIE